MEDRPPEGVVAPAEQCGLGAWCWGSWDDDVQLYFLPATPQAAPLHDCVGD